MAGENVLPTGTIPKATPSRKKSGKKLCEKLIEIRQDCAQGRPIKLMFQDDARFGCISDIRRCWAPRPLRPICQGMLTHEYTYAYSAVDVCTGVLDSPILPHVNTECMQLFLNEVSARHLHDHIVMVIDGAGGHRSHALTTPDNIYLLQLPPYASELRAVCKMT